MKIFVGVVLFLCFFACSGSLTAQSITEIPQAGVVANACGPACPSAVQVLSGSGCGSGSVVGVFSGGSYVMTNAHVAGTRPGTSVTVNVDVNGTRISHTGKIVMSAFSDRTLADWALLSVPGLTGIDPVQMSTTRPIGDHYTRGSPRCVWPLKTTSVTTVDMSNNSPLWRWNPNAIGGQSGSAVWSRNDNKMYGLLTWSWGGFGAGQMTSEIYRQAKNQTVSGEPRVDGLIDLTTTGNKLEVGFFSETGLSDLPVWDNVAPVDPVPENDYSLDEARLLSSIKSKSSKLGIEYNQSLALLTPTAGTTFVDPMFETLISQAERQRVDLSSLLDLILAILQLFQN